MNIAGDFDAVQGLTDAGIPSRVLEVARPARVTSAINPLERAGEDPCRATPGAASGEAAGTTTRTERRLVRACGFLMIASE